MTDKHSKVMPSNVHWAGIIFTLILATVSFLTISGGWVLYIFPTLIYLAGRGRQQMEGEGTALT